MDIIAWLINDMNSENFRIFDDNIEKLGISSVLSMEQYFTVFLSEIETLRYLEVLSKA